MNGAAILGVKVIDEGCWEDVLSNSKLVSREVISIGILLNSLLLLHLKEVWLKFSAVGLCRKNFRNTLSSIIQLIL